MEATMLGGDCQESIVSVGDSNDLTAALLSIASLEWRQSGPLLETTQMGPESFGSFVGLPPQIELLSDGRKARLLAPLSFVQRDGTEWSVPISAELDGASIPKPLWSLIGGPFEGKYRDASIVHDYYCVVRTRSWSDTHRMFYDGMRCGGVTEVKAKVMYYAVYRFGPRWPAPGLEASVISAERPVLSSLNARSMVADAEAIYTQQLSLREIEALADARNAVMAPQVLESVDSVPVDPAALARARLLVVTGGSGNHEDLEAVAREAASLPSYVLARFERKRVRIVACRDNITDYRKRYRNTVPRGWESTGKTWNDVPGAYFPDETNVVIATIQGDSGRSVPTRASGLHGSASLVVHESLHGFDYIGRHAVLSDATFLNARNSDFANLDVYEQQAGQAGLEETFAESGARYAVDGQSMQAAWPNLYAFWDAGSPTSWLEGVPMAGVTEGLGTTGSPEKNALGTAEFTADGAIKLDLRAESTEGAIGHAMLKINPGDSTHENLRKRLLGSANLESTIGRRVLFLP
jgi:hypothetical protein